MCLSVPAKILKIDGTRALVDVRGNRFEADIRLIESPIVGDYVLVHAGFAIEKLSHQDALQTLDLLKELGQ